jgi:chorismate mutase/prephenate dehydratase
MARLFEERMQVSREIAEYKRSHGLSVRDPAREDEMVARNRDMVKDQALEGYYVQFLRNVIDLSCSYQTQVMHGMRVTYSGTEGAYAYMAAKRMFPEAELVAFPDFTEAYRAVEQGDYDCAVLPLENSYAGEVGAVMDLMFSGDLYVNQVVDLPITHSLIAGADATPDSIRKVVSHPQALQQCADYIHRHGFETLTYSNTALAARYVKELGDPTVAAIASEETAAIFGLQVLDTDINDSKNNTTRFAAFSRAKNRPLTSGKREDENFILVFTVQNQAGSLAGALNIIGAHGFNMRNLRSRPMKDLQWNYYFYIEAEGNINTSNGQDMLQELSALCAKLKLVGSYYAGNVQ